MAQDETETDDAPKKKGILMPLLIGLVLAVAAGGGGFWAVTSGPLSGGDSGDSAQDDGHGGGHGSGHGAEEEGSDEPVERPRPELAEVAFVPLDSVVINLGTETNARHLLFTAELEVDPADASEVTHLMPRVMDVINSYLRVVDMQELTDPRTLVRLRAQLLRRIQVVTGDVLVRDLLVTEFVVN